MKQLKRNLSFLKTFLGKKIYYDCNKKVQDRQPCPLTCRELAKEGSSACVTSSDSFNCQSGCFCPPGQVEVNEAKPDQCIDIDNCPCFYEDVVSAV